jgi:hypothetical protein
MGWAVSPGKLLQFGSLHFARPPVERNGKHLGRVAIVFTAAACLGMQAREAAKRRRVPGLNISKSELILLTLKLELLDHLVDLVTGGVLLSRVPKLFRAA